MNQSLQTGMALPVSEQAQSAVELAGNSHSCHSALCAAADSVALSNLFEHLDLLHFGGRLRGRRWRIQFFDSKNSLGEACYDSNRISINRRLQTDPAELRRTVLHEMIHAELFNSNDPSHQKRNEAHGAAFAKELDRLISAGEDLADEHFYVICALTDDESLSRAFVDFESKSNRITDPDGCFRNTGWYPSGKERQRCCRGVREPSRKYPFSLRDHCRTLTHISHLHGVDTVALRSVASVQRKAQEKLEIRSGTLAQERSDVGRIVSSLMAVDTVRVEGNVSPPSGMETLFEYD